MRSSLDLDEGADIVMVKPAMGLPDVVAAAVCRSRYAYQSREYAMIRAAAANNWIERAAVLELADRYPACRRHIVLTCGGLRLYDEALLLSPTGDTSLLRFYEPGASWYWCDWPRRPVPPIFSRAADNAMIFSDCVGRTR